MMSDDEQQKECENLTIEKTIMPNQYFFITGGPTLRSVKELYNYLNTISNEQYGYYASHRGINDFAKWIADVFEEKELAEKIRETTSKEEAIKILGEALEKKEKRKNEQEIVDKKLPSTLFPEKSITQEPLLSSSSKQPQQQSPPSSLPQPPLSSSQPSKPVLSPTAQPPPLQEEQIDVLHTPFTDEETKKLATNDAAFTQWKDEKSEHIEKLNNRYDDIVRHMQRILDDPVPKEIEQRAERLKTRYDELIARISETRRKGKDVIIPALIIRQFSPKLAYAKVSRDEKDFQIAASILDWAETELKEVQEEKEMNFKNEVLALAALDTGKKETTVKGPVESAKTS